jgi:hypothetical protein
MPVLVHAITKPELKPYAMADRFRHDITYFCTSPGEAGAPAKLGPGEWWVRLDDAKKIHEEGVLRIVSPLDSASSTELEISEEHEAWLEWMIANEVEHVRLG